MMKQFSLDNIGYDALNGFCYESFNKVIASLFALNVIYQSIVNSIRLFTAIDCRENHSENQDHQYAAQIDNQICDIPRLYQYLIGYQSEVCSSNFEIIAR